MIKRNLLFGLFVLFLVSTNVSAYYDEMLEDDVAERVVYYGDHDYCDLVDDGRMINLYCYGGDYEYYRGSFDYGLDTNFVYDSYGYDVASYDVYYGDDAVEYEFYYEDEWWLTVIDYYDPYVYDEYYDEDGWLSDDVFYAYWDSYTSMIAFDLVYSRG